MRCKRYHIMFSTFSLKFKCKICVQKEVIHNFKTDILVRHVTGHELTHLKKMVRVWKSKSLLFSLRYDPLIVFFFKENHHIIFIFLINDVTWPLSANGLVFTCLVWWLIRWALFQPFLILHPGGCLKRWQHFCVCFCFVWENSRLSIVRYCLWTGSINKLRDKVVDFIWTIPYDSNYKRFAIKISKHQRWKTTVPLLKDVHGQGLHPFTKKSDRFHNHCNLLTLLEQTRMGI